MTEDDSLFNIFTLNGKNVYGTQSALTNIHSHYIGPDLAVMKAYRYSGKIKMTASNSGIGVTFFSQYPVSDAYYRLRRYSNKAFHVSPHGTNVKGDLNTGVVPQVNAWYKFLVEIEDTSTKTVIRAKVWKEGAKEPNNWQANCYDNSNMPLRYGTIGIWSNGTGSKYWDDLKVIPYDS
jgi:hypothetical protein